MGEIPVKKNGRSVGAIGAVAALITALTPLYIEFFNSSGEKAQVVAKQSNEKTEVGYQILKHQILSLEDKISILNEDIRETQKLLREVLVDRLKSDPKPRKTAARKPIRKAAKKPARKPASGGEGEFVDLLDKLDDQMAEVEMTQEQMDIGVAQMPETLEDYRAYQ